MKSFLKCGSALAVLFLLAGTAMGSDALATGTIKGIDAYKGEFVLTDSAGKDVTFKLGDAVVVNRGGTESKSDLKADDAVNVSYDKGLATNTAKYILVQEGDSKKWELAQGSFKSYDADRRKSSARTRKTRIASMSWETPRCACARRKPRKQRKPRSRTSRLATASSLFCKPKERRRPCRP